MLAPYRGYTHLIRMTARSRKPVDVLAIPNYGPIEVAEVLHIAPATLHYWIGKESGRLITPAQRTPPILSFKNLVECYVLDIIRRIHKVSMPNVRFSVETLKALQKAQHLMKTPYPLADHDLKIDEHKRLFVYDLQGRIVNLTAGGQIEVAEWVAACLKRVVRDRDGVARRFHPLIRRHNTLQQAAADPSLVVVDPRISFGKPVLVNSAISTEVIAGRIVAGDLEEELANEYGRTRAEIRAAAQFENVPITA